MKELTIAEMEDRRIAFRVGVNSWIEQERLWGVYPDEEFEE